MSRGWGRTVRGRLLAAAVTGLAYAGLGGLAQWLLQEPTLGPSFYPGAGVTLSALVLLDVAAWPGALAAVFLAEAAVDVAHGYGAVATLGWALANTVEPLTGAALLRGWAARRARRGDDGPADPLTGRCAVLARRSNLVSFVLCAVVLGPLAGAVVGAVTNSLVRHDGSPVSFGLEWMVGDGLGVIVVAGAVLGAAGASRAERDRLRSPLGVALPLVGLAGTVALFWGPYRAFGAVVPLPALVGAAVYGGTALVGGTGLLIAFVLARAVAVGQTAGMTFEVAGTPQDRAALQVTFGVLLVMALMLAAEIRERELSVRAATLAEQARAEAERRRAATEGALHLQEDVARRLQATLLPARLPDVPWLAMTGRYHAAEQNVEVGGDFYDVVRLADGRVVVSIGDVAGRGVEAAAITGLARVVLRIGAGRPPSRALAKLNRVLGVGAGAGAIGEEDRLLTAAQIVLAPDPAGVTGTVCLAGHPAPLLRRAGGRAVEPLGEPGTLLGAFDEVDLTETQVRLQAGDLLVLYTDGVLEARAPDGSMYGSQRLEAVLAGLPPAAGVDDVADAVLADVAHFRTGAAEATSDDVAVLAVRVQPDRTGPGGKAVVPQQAAVQATGAHGGAPATR